MMKKIWALLLVLAMAVGLTACGGNGQKEEPAKETSGESAPAEKAEGTETPTGKKRMALIITDSTQPYAAWLADSFEQVGAKQFPDVELTVLDGKFDISTQISLLENCKVQKYDYVVIQTIDTDSVLPTIYDLIDAGVPVCITNNTGDPEKKASNVDVDIEGQGMLPAQVAAEVLPENAKVVVLMGPSGNKHSEGRRVGWQKYCFDVRPDIEILDEQIADWQKDKGMSTMEDWLQRYPEIDAVVSMGDGMCLGAIEACKAANRMEGMNFFGVDGTAEACLSIKAGELTATTLQNAYEQAVMSLELGIRVINGESDVEQIQIENVLIDKSNVEEWLPIYVESGQLTEDALK